MERFDMEDPTEVWRPIEYFEGHYEASNLGRVRSVKRAAPHLMTQRVAENGYRNVMISMCGKYRPYGVHRLVLMAFAGERDKGVHACHVDGDKSNNRLSNLYWGTPAENAADMKRHGRHRNGRKTHCKNGHEFTPENTYIQPGRGIRKCIACRDIYWQEWKARRSA